MYKASKEEDKGLGELGSPEWKASFLFSMLTGINVMTVLFFCLRNNFISSGRYMNLNKMELWFIFIPWVFLPSLYFIRNKRYLKIENKFEELNNKHHLLCNVIYKSYWVITFVLLFVVLIA
ncbi:hypothetical protein [Aureibacter tunicatorum]|uniref:hypothetical protein n=1 Tax=Aureibacter tunicatorum TaxID=866807 RepID=UPI00286BD51F|nr:hypothetical protein [Aureibacter tunicatorum]